MWVGTSGGVAHLLHPESVFDPVALDVAVTAIKRGDKYYSEEQQITLPWSTQQLQIQVSSSTMRNRSDLIFKSQLEGLQTDWVESQDGKAVFAALPPGNYTFKAMARNPGLDATSSTIYLHFTILPPWWRTNWFFALCAVVFLLLLMAFDRLRARTLRARSRELERMVRERTLKLEERTRELEASREQLRVQATQDGLTGMLNHVAILRVLAAEMDRARREKRTLVLAMADLDHFKRVNDVYGHQAGDEALRAFAAAVKTAIRVYDQAGRYGGEEFLLVLTEIPREATEHRLLSLHSAVSNLKVQCQESKFTITCSIGAIVFEPSANPRTVESLLAAADQALYAAKAGGRNCVVFHEAGHESPQPASTSQD